MKKLPFTSQGVSDLQALLYRLDEPGLCNEAGLIAEDFLLWASSRFEMEVYLLEDLRNLPVSFKLKLGWCLAASVLGRLPLDLGDLRNGEERGESPGRLAVSFSVSQNSSIDKASQGRLVLSLQNTP